MDLEKNGFLSGEVAINIGASNLTEFLDTCMDLGLKWANGDSLDNKEILSAIIAKNYGESLCIRFDPYTMFGKKGLRYGSVRVYQNMQQLQVIRYQDILAPLEVDTLELLHVLEG